MIEKDIKDMRRTFSYERNSACCLLKDLHRRKDGVIELYKDYWNNVETFV